MDNSGSDGTKKPVQTPKSRTSPNPTPSKTGDGDSFVKASKAQAEADHQARLVQFYHKQHMDAVAGAAQGDPNAIATERKIVGKLPQGQRQQVQAQDTEQAKASFAANDPQLKTQDAVQGGVNHAMMMAALLSPVLGMMLGPEAMAGKAGTAAGEEAGTAAATRAGSSVGRRAATYTDKGVSAAKGSGSLRSQAPAGGKGASGARSGSSGIKDAGKKGQPTEKEISQGGKDYPRKGSQEGDLAQVAKGKATRSSDKYKSDMASRKTKRDDMAKSKPSKDENMKAWKDRKDARDKAATPKSQVKSKLEESVKRAQAKKKGSK